MLTLLEYSLSVNVRFSLTAASIVYLAIKSVDYKTHTSYQNEQ
jgi:hypothetical protein